MIETSLDRDGLVRSEARLHLYTAAKLAGFVNGKRPRPAVNLYPERKQSAVERVDAIQAANAKRYRKQRARQQGAGEQTLREIDANCRESA